jgi:tetratricopeptide (TPR) repeat protein
VTRPHQRHIIGGGPLDKNKPSDTSDNRADGHVDGHLLQAREIHGGIHLHGNVQPRVLPRQLPPVARHFVGRRRELGELSKTLVNGGAISAIDGTAGIGKTTLAVYWARGVSDQFPDGQLYVNLRGFGPGDPMLVAEAVRGFLDAFEVPPERIPVSFDAQLALYRSLLADRKVLIVLDNARDADQVRPLLPGSPSCRVVVTSRTRLAGLVALDGAHPVTLDVLATNEATALLTNMLGRARVRAQPDAVEELIRCCALLPLALTITAALASMKPHSHLATIVNELRDERHRLDLLDVGDASSSVRAVFSWSYRVLTEPAARLFRVLGLHPGLDIGLSTASSLAGITISEARGLLGELNRAHLLEDQISGWFRMHDLLRAYAAEQSMAIDEEPERRAASQRVLDCYLHTATAAALRLQPHRDPIDIKAVSPGVVLDRVDDYQQALDWFTAQHNNLFAAIRHAVENEFDGHAWQLAWTLRNFLDRRGRWYDRVATAHLAVTAADRLGDRTARARSYRLLGGAFSRLGQHADACVHLDRSLALYRELGDQTGQAHTCLNIGAAYGRQDRLVDALSHTELALELFRTVGHQPGEARALNALGWCHSLLGAHEQALVYCEQGLSAARNLNDRHGEAAALENLGHIYRHLGVYDRATERYRRALDLYRKLGDPYYEATTLTKLGDALGIAGNKSEASECWQAAVAILDGLKHPDAADVRARLVEPNPTTE